MAQDWSLRPLNRKKRRPSVHAAAWLRGEGMGAKSSHASAARLYLAQLATVFSHENSFAPPQKNT